ncbi:PH domain-containing protein [Kineococcus sp. LSe6-4]|uniref:PH domain-containing protein n=1 Tax=Kineococcus halophytocola TaxID=3234027 RepID=A0ABV4H1R2_9ACTN
MSSGTRLRRSRGGGAWRVVGGREDAAGRLPGLDDDPLPAGDALDEDDDFDDGTDDGTDEAGADADDEGPGAAPGVGRAGDPLWERPPRRVRRYVLGTEKRLVCLRRHLVVLAEPVLTCVVGFAGWLWLVVHAGDVPHLPNVTFVGWLALLGRAVWKWLQWRGDWFIATDKRLLLAYGVVKRQVAMMPLSKVTDMSYNRSLLGRFLGYGELVMESAGQDQALSDVDRLPMPDQVYVRICEQLFGQVGAVDAPRRRRSRVGRLVRGVVPSRFR